MYIMEKIMKRRPPVTRPRLKIGATPLLEACPRSLKAFSSHLNHGERYMERNIEDSGIIIAKAPRSVAPRFIC
jgi:hypothetical protein